MLLRLFVVGCVGLLSSVLCLVVKVHIVAQLIFAMNNIEEQG